MNHVVFMTSSSNENDRVVAGSDLPTISMRLIKVMPSWRLERRSVTGEMPGRLFK